MPTQAERMLELFRGFSGAHGTYDTEDYNPDKRKQEQRRTTRTLRQPVTTELWERHLAGSYHLGIITITEENSCWWAAIDVDDYDIDHTSLVAELTTLGVPAHVARTKSGGAHVYLFFSEPVPAREVVPRLRQLAAVLGRADSEVFPKQLRVASDLQGLGNWVNMPYFGGDDGRNYAVSADGRGLSVEKFLSTAHASRLSRRDLLGLRLRVSSKGWEEAPPCLEYLYSVRDIRQGMQNNAMFNFAVLAKRMYPEGWQQVLERWNSEVCTPPYPIDGMGPLVKRHLARDYGYKCLEVPCVNHCNQAECRTRKYGVTAGGDAGILDSMSILDTEPPLYHVTLKTGGVVRCSHEVFASSKRFRVSAMGQLNVAMPIYSENTWNIMIAPLMESAVKIEVPDEVGTTGHFAELLERFCTDKHTASTVDELIMGKPWLDEDTDTVWFRFRDLTDFLGRSKFDELSRAEITDRLKKMGAEYRQVHTSRSTVNVWGMRAGSFTWRRDRLPTPAPEETPF